MSDSEYSDSDCDTISEIGDDELACKNMDPALAKIMGIIVEETKTDWTPPSHSGLNNSEKIIKDKECELEKIIKKIKLHLRITKEIFTYTIVSTRCKKSSFLNCKIIWESRRVKNYFANVWRYCSSNDLALVLC